MTADDRGLAERDELTDRLAAIDFRAPPLAELWSPAGSGAVATRRTGGRPRYLQLGWRALAAAAVLALLTVGLAMAAFGVFPIDFGLNARDGCPDPDSCGPNYEVTARSDSEVAPVTAFNVVVADGTDRGALAALAEAFADRRPESRTIVYLFAESSDQERYGFPLVPGSADPAAEPASDPLDAAAWLALFDFPPAGEPVVRWGPAAPAS